MLTQPAGQGGCPKPMMDTRWVSSGKLNDGSSPHGETVQPTLTVFSSSSKKTRVTSVSEVLHLPRGCPSRSSCPPTRLLFPAEPRHTLKKEVVAEATAPGGGDVPSNQRAA